MGPGFMHVQIIHYRSYLLYFQTEGRVFAALPFY